jgi:hypothetical protein
MNVCDLTLLYRLDLRMSAVGTAGCLLWKQRSGILRCIAVGFAEFVHQPLVGLLSVLPLFFCLETNKCVF